MSRTMVTRLPLHGILVASLALVAVGATGCFESKHPVGPREAGKVDLGYVGDWTLRNEAKADADTLQVVIRNLHNDEYYVELIDKNGKRSRATGHLTDVDDASFASILPLTDDGKLAGKYSIWRIDRQSSDQFNIRGLKPEFFKDKKIESSNDLRKLLAANLANDAMYLDDTLVATRQKAEVAKEHAAEK